jgi:5-methylcytosine-specific restriction endonuclease McrA
MYDPRPEYNSPAYKSWRYAVMARDKWICQVTGKKGNLEVHHILPWAEYPHLRYAVSNGITLDKDFHQNIVTGREHEYAEQFRRIVEMKKIQKTASKIKAGKKKAPRVNMRLRNPKARF